MVELSVTELGLIQIATRKTAMHFWGEMVAAQKMNTPPDDAMNLAIIRMFSTNAEKMCALHMKLFEASKVEALGTVVLTTEELATAETSLREPIIRALGESTLYQLDTYYQTDDKEFRTTMGQEEARCSAFFIALAVKLSKHRKATA